MNTNLTTSTTSTTTNAGALLPPTASDDNQLINMWLLSKPSSRTRTEYSRTVKQFLTYLPDGVTLRQVSYSDVLMWKESLAHLKPNTIKTRVATIKSLLSFAQTIGYTIVNVGTVVSATNAANERAQRCLTELEVFQVISGVKSVRDKLMLRLLYTTGIRVSELVSLRWCDLSERSSGGQVTVLGKGSKSRAINIPAALWTDLMVFKSNTTKHRDSLSPVFASRQRDSDGSYFLSIQQVQRIVSTAAKNGGVDKAVSPHWMRHSHASHSLDRGAPISLVSTTLGHSNISVTNAYIHSRPDHSSSEYLVAV